MREKNVVHALCSTIAANVVDIINQRRVRKWRNLNHLISTSQLTSLFCIHGRIWLIKGMSHMSVVVSNTFHFLNMLLRQALALDPAVDDVSGGT